MNSLFYTKYPPFIDWEVSTSVKSLLLHVACTMWWHVLFSPSFLPFYFPTTNYFNIFFLLSIYFPLILLLIPIDLLSICHFLFYFMHSFLTKKKKNCYIYVNFLFFLHLYFKLNNFVLFRTLLWVDVIFFCILSYLFHSFFFLIL